MKRGITRLSRARRFQLKRIERGLCPTCPNELPEGVTSRCPECVVKKREWAQKKYGHKPWQAGKPGRPPVWVEEEA